MYAIRDAKSADYPAILNLNESELPHVSSLNEVELARLAGESAYLRVVDGPSGPAGFLLAFGPGADYRSPNFLWFKERYPAFIYVDRIVIAAEARGRGMGRAFYEDLARHSPAPVMTCEVNLNPPNPESMEFHRRVGFSQVGTQDTDGGKKTVAMLLKPI